MQRREFITLVGGAAAAWPFAAEGQVPDERPLIVWLGSGIQADAGRFVGALREGLEELGHVEGRNIELIGR